eukprot:jgi/Tetstr1/460965/TSEL_006117.t1
MADQDCGSGPAHVDGVARGLLLIIFLNCCAPLTAVRRGRDVAIVDALKWAAPRIWEVAAASPLGVVRWLEQKRPEVLAELRKVRNLCTGRLAQSKSLVPLGVADDRYRTDVCQGNEDAATYSRPGLAFLLHAQDVHASSRKGGVNPAFALGCPRYKDLAGVTPCFRIFESLNPNTCAMTRGPKWQILSYHVPGMPAVLLEVDIEDEARRRKHETARTMAAAKEMRHWNPEAHIGDDEYSILADVKATRLARLARVAAAVGNGPPAPVSDDGGSKEDDVMGVGEDPVGEDGMDIDAPAWPPAGVEAADEGVIREGDPGDFYMKVIAKKFRGVWHYGVTTGVVTE